MITKETIRNFFEPKKIAVAGASRNPKKFCGALVIELTKKGFEILPVNPNADKINDQKCYKSVEDLPTDVSSLLIVTPKENTDEVLRQAITKGIKNIWVQQFSETKDTIKIAEEYDKEIIYKKCVYMFAEPTVGIHKFHRTIAKLFGRLPK